MTTTSNQRIAPTYSFPAREPRNLSLREKNKQGLFDFVTEYALVIPASRFDDWRMTYPALGTIKGQPHYGDCMLRATDGIHAFCELVWLDNPRPLIKIHFTNWNGQYHPQGWEPKRSWKASSSRTTKTKTPSKRKSKSASAKLLEALTDLLKEVPSPKD